MRPRFMMITRSHSRSTSAMLWEASSTVAPRAHPVGGVGVERGGRLVEQQHLRRVDQRLGERHACLLSGRELADRPIEKFGEVELLRQRGDAGTEVLDGIEPAEHSEVL